MSFCDFVPDDPSCAPPEPEPTPDSGNGGEGGMEPGNEVPDQDEMMAQWGFFFAAFGVFGWSAAQLFRYRNVTGYYTSTGASLLNNYYEMWAKAQLYWFFVSHLVLTITQLGGMFGGMGETNIMTWMYIGLANMVVATLLQIFYIYAYDLYWADVNAATAATMANSATQMEAMEADHM